MPDIPMFSCDKHVIEHDGSAFVITTFATVPCPHCEVERLKLALRTIRHEVVQAKNDSHEMYRAVLNIVDHVLSTEEPSKEP